MVFNSCSDEPKISLITPSYNQAPFLEETILSVLNQSYPNLEYIIIDGGSTDGSVDIVQKYADHLTYWVSEPDAGQTDALCKGFARASGDLMNWLNSDDVLLPNALLSLGEAYRNTQADLIVGEGIDFKDGNLSQPVRQFFPAHYSHPECWQVWTHAFCYHQPCTFFSRRLYEKVGGLNPALHYAMDFDFYCRMLAQPTTQVQYIHHPIAGFRLHNDAKTHKAKPYFLREQHQVLLNHSDIYPLTPAHLVALHRFIAQCNWHNTTTALRQGDWPMALTACVDGLRSDPDAFLRYGLRRCISWLKQSLSPKALTT